MDFNSSLLQEALLKIKNHREPHQSVNSVVKNLLHSNNLAIRPIPEVGPNLMRAVSDCLYFTTTKHQEIQALCFRYFQKLFQSKKLTRNLQKFNNNFALLSHYCTNPEHSNFDDVNFEMVSIIYQVKVIVFSVGDDSYLNSRQINSKNHSKSIQLLWDDGTYTPVYDETYLEHALISQNLVYEILGDVLQAELVNPENEFVNLEHQHWLEKEQKKESRLSPYKFPSSTHQVESLSLKRSLSQQDLKETQPLEEGDINKVIQAPVGYHNLKTANERIQTQGKPIKKFTFNLNECNDDEESPTVTEDPRTKFIAEFLDPISNHLHIPQRDEIQECAPISPVGYKQFTAKNTQLQAKKMSQQFTFTPFQQPAQQFAFLPFAQSQQFMPLPLQPALNDPSLNFFAPSYNFLDEHLDQDSNNQMQPFSNYQAAESSVLPSSPAKIQAEYQKVSEAWQQPGIIHSQIQQQVKSQSNFVQPTLNEGPTTMMGSVQQGIIPPVMTQFGQPFQIGYSSYVDQNIYQQFSEVNEQNDPFFGGIVIGQPIEKSQVVDGVILNNNPNALITKDSQQFGINQIGQIRSEGFLTKPDLKSRQDHFSSNSIKDLKSVAAIDRMNTMAPVYSDSIKASISQLAPLGEPCRFQQFPPSLNDPRSMLSILQSQDNISMSDLPQPTSENNDNHQNQDLFPSTQQQFYQPAQPFQSSFSNTEKSEQQSGRPNNSFNNEIENGRQDNRINTQKSVPFQQPVIPQGQMNQLVGQGGQEKKVKPHSNQSINQTEQKREQTGKVKELKKPEVLEQTEQKKKGRLKFFDTSNNFGFFNLDEDRSDVFVHLEDLQATSVPKETLMHSSLMNLRFQFHFIKYIGKHKNSRKAVDIEYLPDESDETIQQPDSTSPEKTSNLSNTQPAMTQPRKMQNSMPNSNFIPKGQDNQKRNNNIYYNDNQTDQRQQQQRQRYPNSYEASSRYSDNQNNDGEYLQQRNQPIQQYPQQHYQPFQAPQNNYSYQNQQYQQFNNNNNGDQQDNYSFQGNGNSYQNYPPSQPPPGYSQQNNRKYQNTNQFSENPSSVIHNQQQNNGNYQKNNANNLYQNKNNRFSNNTNSRQQYQQHQNNQYDSGQDNRRYYHQPHTQSMGAYQNPTQNAQNMNYPNQQYNDNTNFNDGYYPNSLQNNTNAAFNGDDNYQNSNSKMNYQQQQFKPSNNQTVPFNQQGNYQNQKQNKPRNNYQQAPYFVEQKQ